MAKLATTAVVMSMFWTAVPSPTAAQVKDPLQEFASQTIRSIDFDFCLPADALEYAALGKHAIIMLSTSTAIASELPLRSVFVDVAGVRVPLRRVWRSEIQSAGSRYKQISFYLIPIQLAKRTGRLAADFSGDRRDFGIATFGPDFIDKDAPAFARLDEYDDPGEPDDEAVRQLLIREYPDYFQS